MTNIIPVFGEYISTIIIMHIYYNANIIHSVITERDLRVFFLCYLVIMYICRI
jgi:hypothetical protein